MSSPCPKEAMEAGPQLEGWQEAAEALLLRLELGPAPGEMEGPQGEGEGSETCSYCVVLKPSAKREQREG